MARPDTAFIFNPTSLSGSAGQHWAHVARHAEEVGIALERLETLPSPGTRDLARDLTLGGQYRTIVALGGDGTIGEVVQGIMTARDSADIPRHELPSLAVIPFGTGNNIAKSFGIEPVLGPLGVIKDNLERAVETVKYGADFRFDLGRVDGRYFADAFSIGLDPSILRERNQEHRRVQKIPVLRQFLRDYLLYTWAFARVPFSHRHVNATVEMDDEREMDVENLTNLVVNNVKVYAGEFIFSADSRANDGLLDVVLFTGWRDYLSKFIAASRGTPIHPRMLRKALVRHSSYYKTRTLRVRLERPLPSQVDGEEYRTGDLFEVSTVENALTFKTPV